MRSVMRLIRVFLLLAGLLGGAVYGAPIPGSEESPVAASLISEVESVQPGKPFWVAVVLDLDDEWHAYWKNPGGIGFPIAVEWHLPEGTQAGELNWPHPEKIAHPNGIAYGYSDKVHLLVPITPHQNLADSSIELKAEVTWLVCSESACLPGSATVTLRLPVADNEPVKTAAHVERFRQARANLPQKLNDVKVEHHKDLVLLEFHLPDEANVPPDQIAGYFCPEESGILDESFPLQLEKHPTLANHYLLTLKCLPDRPPTPALKGALVVHHPDSQVKQSWDLEFPLRVPHGADRLIAVADRKLGQLSMPPYYFTEEMTAVEKSDYEGGFAAALLFAFLGGLILNLMPCVLPVVSLKMLSFVKLSGQSRSVTWKHGLLFSFGVLLSFWILATILIVLQSYGQMMGWGFQLQEPIFVAVLAAIILVFGLSLFGVFEIGTFFASWAGQAESDLKTKQGGYWGSFFSGVLATTVATPCTGPFMGAAIGFAMTLSPLWCLILFTSLGLGMASPYLLVAAFPELIRFLPKPGAWMEGFKQFMGFCMLATALWLLWVFGAQTDQMALFTLLFAFLLLAFGCWIYGRWSSPMNRPATRYLGTFAALLFLMMGGVGVYKAAVPPAEGYEASAETKGNWIPFSTEVLQAMREEGKPVFIDFTAKWCLICQTNGMVLNMREVDAKMTELGIVRMEADWTKYDSAITAMLRKYGRNGVPLYLLFPADSKEPMILPQVLTPDIVVDYLNKLDSVSIALP